MSFWKLEAHPHRHASSNKAARALTRPHNLILSNDATPYVPVGDISHLNHHTEQSEDGFQMSMSEFYKAMEEGIVAQMGRNHKTKTDT